jgi:hypothetical protein
MHWRLHEQELHVPGCKYNLIALALLDASGRWDGDICLPEVALQTSGGEQSTQPSRQGLDLLVFRKLALIALIVDLVKVGRIEGAIR